MLKLSDKLLVAGMFWNLDSSAGESSMGTLISQGNDPRAIEHSIIKSNPHRSVRIIRLNGSVYYLKEHRCENLSERLKRRLLGSRAEAEWHAIQKMRNIGIHTPEPVAYALSAKGSNPRSILITKAIENAVNLREAVESVSTEKAVRLATSLGAQLRAIHDKGVYHRDLQPGNLFVDMDGEGFRFYFLDLHKASFPEIVSSRQRIKDIGRLVFNLKTFACSEIINALINGYSGKDGTPSLDKLILQQAGKFSDLRKRSRSKRCLRNSTHFARERVGKFRIYRQRKVEGANLLDAIKLIRDSGKNVVEMGNDGQKFYVKEISSEGLWQNLKDLFQRPRGRRAWHAANALLVRGIPTPTPIALVEEVHSCLVKRSWLFTEYQECAPTLTKYAHENFVIEKSSYQNVHSFMLKLVDALSNLYKESIYHGDLKASNILVRKNGSVEILFIDLDGNHLWRKPGPGRIIKNLVQLYCSLPFCVSKFVAADFFVRFLKKTGLRSKLRHRLPEILLKIHRRRERWIAIVRKHGKIL